MKTNRRRVSERSPRSLKWWWRHNRIYIFIILAIGLVFAFAVTYEIKFFQRRQIPENILNKDRETVEKQGGYTDDDVGKLKRFYPGTDWEKDITRKGYLRRKEQEKTDRKR